MSASCLLRLTEQYLWHVSENPMSIMVSELRGSSLIMGMIIVTPRACVFRENV